MGRRLTVAPHRDQVGVVVVSWRPDAGLPERIQSMGRHGHWTVVVDNGSGPAYEETLKAVSILPNVSIIHLSRNLGIATALNRGLREVAQAGCAWALLFDQDSDPNEGLLSGLIATWRAHPHRFAVGIIGANYRDLGTGDVHRSALMGQDWLEVDEVITSGSLVSLAAVADAGGMRDDLFIDQVDFEFCYRLHCAGWRVLETAQPLMEHRLGAARRHRCGPLSFTASHHGALRRYYMTRNTLVVWRCYRTRLPVAARRQLIDLAKQIAKLVVVEPDPWRKLSAVALGVAHAWTGRMGRIRMS